MIHSGGGVWKELVDSQSNPMGGYKAEIWNSPSIGSRIPLLGGWLVKGLVVLLVVLVVLVVG